MGGEFRETIVKATSKEELHKAFLQEKENDAWDYGQVLIIPVPVGKIYWDKMDAYEHAEENEKWGYAWAYQISEDEYYLAGWCSS